MLREMLGGYAPSANRLTLHDLGELIRRAGRDAGFEVQSEFRLSVGGGVAGEIDWVWLDQGHVVAAFEIEGHNAAPASLAADYEKFVEVGSCLKVVALYSVSSKLAAKAMPPAGFAPQQWVAHHWPHAGMPGIQVILDTDLMAPDGIESIQRQAKGVVLNHTRSIQERCASPEFLIIRLVMLAMYFVECVEEGFGANTKACDALLHPGLKRPRSFWSGVRSVVFSAPKAPVTAMATWIASEWFDEQCASANVSPADIAHACTPFERELAADRVTDAETLRMRAAVRAVRYLNVRRQAALGSDSRAFEHFIPDVHVPVGKGESGTEHREHVIPLKLLRNRCNLMLEAGASVERVAEWLRTFLAIVRITKDQARMLDHTHGWKTSMPLDWNFESGCIYERLHRAEIAFFPHPAAPCRCAT